MEAAKEITANTLRSWLSMGKDVTIPDVRPAEERREWIIPGSIHLNAYEKLKANGTGALQGL